MLPPLVVVIMDKLLNGFYKFLIGFKMVEIIHLTLQDAPETLHWAIVNTSANTRHTLLYSLLFHSETAPFSLVRGLRPL